MAPRRGSGPVELLTLLASTAVAFDAPGVGDYPTDAGPAVSALAGADLHGFFAHQPAMGAASLILRAPFLALGAALHASPLGLYRWGDLPCLLALALLSIWLSRAALRRAPIPPSPTDAVLTQVAIGAVCLANPLVRDALYWGHPEEILTASLAAGALLAACEQRWLLTAALLGLAVASKQWAVVVAVPALLILERDRVRAAAGAAAVALTATLPMAIANPGAFAHVLRYISHPQPVVTALTWLYPLSPSGRARVSNLFGDTRVMDVHTLSALQGMILRPAITLLAAAIPLWVWWRLRRRPQPAQLLFATAMVLVVRCALDPGTMPYYHLALLLTLVVIDAVQGRRMPVHGLIGAALAFVVLDRFATYLPPVAANAIYIVTTVLACAVVLARLRGSPPRAPERAPLAASAM